MTHEEARAAYSRRLDGMSDKEADALLDAHLAGCGECRQYCEGLKWAASSVEELRPAPPVPEGLLEEVRKNIFALPQPRSRPFWGLSALVLASALLVFLVARQKPVPQQTAPLAVETAAAPARPIAAEPSASPIAARPAASLQQKAAAVLALPSAAARDILAIERMLRAVPQAARQVVFRGAGREDPLAAALSGADLENLTLTDEISAILKARHKRLARLDALKADGRLKETPAGLLAAAPAVSEEKTLIEAENKDRAALLRLYAAQLAPSSKDAERIEPRVKEEFARALAR